MPPSFAFVLKGYPRLSETFIAQEIRGLETRGIDIHIFALRNPTDPTVHPVHREIEAPVTYLPEYLHWQPLRVLRAWRHVRRLPGYAEARRRWLRDLRREPTRNRVRRFGQALVLACELPAQIGWLHAHFLHTPASVTRYAALIRGLPWSASAHAKDVWTTPAWEKREKLAELRWLVTCTRVNLLHLRPLAKDPERVSLLYHGLDLRRFPSPNVLRPPRDGSAAAPVTLLSVGRTVEKKGYDVLLEALARLPADLSWRLVHIGGGELSRSLQRHARTLGIAARIDWLGPLPQDQVLYHYRIADLFVLASRIAGDGDRDGLPNVLMEAQSQALACVSTTVSAIPELIIDGETGVLVPPGEPAPLTAAIERLIRVPAERNRLAIAGMRRVRRVFSYQESMDELARRFSRTSEPVTACASPSTPQ
jgi:Glycosyltransferase